MIRQIVLSQAYRQSSLHAQASEYEVVDPANNYLWRANRRRLDAEALRDSMLLVSGRLNLRAGGESFKAPINAEALEGLSMKGGAYQASAATERRPPQYLLFRERSLAVPLMTVFDCCDTTHTAGRRDVTTVAPASINAHEQREHYRSQSGHRRAAARVERPATKNRSRLAPHPGPRSHAKRKNRSAGSLE